MPDLSRLTNLLRSRTAIVAVIASVSTVVLVGAVLLTMTSLGCGARRALGFGPTDGCVAAIGQRSSPRPGIASPSSFPAFVPYVPPATSQLEPTPAAPQGPYVGNVSAYPGPGSSSEYAPFIGPGSGPPGARALSCRLPVYAGPAGSGGFIAFPDATFIADPRSDVTVSLASSAQGYSYPGGYGMWWDRTHSRWLPVPYAWVSPDESRYAYPGTDGVYVTNVPSGAVSELGSSQQWTIIDVEAAGVYATRPGSPGLWLLPFSGNPRQITPGGYWQAANANAAFGTSTSAVPSGAANTIIKLDFKTGAITDWFTRRGAQSSVAGFDRAGEPIVYVQGQGGTETWLVSSPMTGTLIAATTSFGQGSGGFSPSGTPIADVHGIWFSGNGGIALFVPGSGLYWMTSVGAQLAGGCH